MENSKLALTEQDRDRLFAAIGHVVVSFQQAELMVSEILAGLLGLDLLQDRYAVMSAMSFRQKVDLLATLFPTKAKNHSGADIEQARRALYAAEEFRNRVVHSVWAVCESEGTWIREKGNLKGRKGFSKQSVNVDIAELEAAAESIRVIKDWYFVSSTSLEAAHAQIKACKQLT